MNFKYVFGFLSLICLVSQACAWKWQNGLALNEALQNFIKNKEDHPLLGMDVTKMNEEEKIKICTDAATRVDLTKLSHNVMKASDAKLRVNIPINSLSSENQFFSVFSCGETEKKTYFFGKGPRKNTIAVYLLPKNYPFGRAYGIMDYTLQLQQSQAHAWKWYGSDALRDALKNFFIHKEVFPFLGKGIRLMDEDERKKICTDAAIEKDMEMPSQTVIQLSSIVDFKAEIVLSEKNEFQTLYGVSCGSTEEKIFFLGQGPWENTYAMYASHNFIGNKLVYGLAIMDFIGNKLVYDLGIMDYYWQPQALVWRWQDVYELNEALQRNLTFSGKDVTEMSNREKMKICINAITFAMLPQIVVELSDVTNLAVAINVNGINKEQTFPVFSCGKNEKIRYFLGKGPSENTITMYTRVKNSALGVPLGIIDSLAWKWQNVLELNKTLLNYHPFLGQNVTEMGNVEKMEICTNAITLAMPPQIVVELSDVTNLAVGIIVDGINKEQTFSVFSCGEIEGRRYFFGKGPRENTIAVYTKMENSDLGVPLGIMDYSSQPPQ